MDRQVGVNLWTIAAWLVFVCAFFMPAYRTSPPREFDLGGHVETAPADRVKSEPGLPAGFQLKLGGSSLSGWSAMGAAFDGNTYAVASATTNVLMILSLLSLWSTKFAGMFFWVMGATALFNLWWIVALGSDARDLTVGYFVWVLSFAMAAIGLHQRSRPPQAASV